MKTEGRLLMVALLLGAVMIGHAQQKGRMGPSDRAAKLTTWMKDSLALTPTQIPLIDSINVKYANKVEAVRTGQQERSQKFSAMKDLDNAKDIELKKVLTADQFKTYLLKKEEMREKMEARRSQQNN